MSYLTENALASIVIVTYNNKNDVDEIIQSLLLQSYSNFEVIVVDNASSDGTADYIEEHYPVVRVLRSKVNLGYCGGNVIGVNAAIGDYIIILNPDVVLDQLWLEELLYASKKYPTAGIIGSNILFYKDNSSVNTYGVNVHFTGLTFTRCVGKPQSNCSDEFVLAPAGTAFMVARWLLEKTSFIDPDYFMELGEIDFAIRAYFSGSDIRVVAKSKVYHKYIYKMSPRRLYALERSRYKLLTSTYSKRTLAILAPGLMLSEFITVGFSFLMGKHFLRAKLESFKCLLTFYKRKGNCVTSGTDKELIKLMDWRIDFPENVLTKFGLGKHVNQVLNSIYFKLYSFVLSFA